MKADHNLNPANNPSFVLKMSADDNLLNIQSINHQISKKDKSKRRFTISVPNHQVQRGLSIIPEL